MPLLLQSIMWLPVRLVFAIFLRYKVIGAENLNTVDTSKGVILVANHSSQLDPIFVGAALRFFSKLRPVYFVTLSSEFYRHLSLGFLMGGWLFKQFGGLPAYRGTNDYSAAFRHHIKILSKGKTVCIFPEGGITTTGEIGTPKPGVAHLAEISGAEIIPVHIGGAWRTTASDFFTFKRKITVRIGKPFTYKKPDAEKIMSKVSELATDQNAI